MKTFIYTVLCVTDRVPNLSDINFEKAGVKVKQEAIAVDEYSCISQTNIFAVEDCTNRPHWTPVAIASDRPFADTVLANQPLSVNFECIPLSLSSQPEAATVGLTEAEAREKFGESVRCYCSRFQPLFVSIAEPLISSAYVLTVLRMLTRTSYGSQRICHISCSSTED